jgi:hypothetical protein
VSDFRLEDLLDELATQGAFDSASSFTLNPELAREKLRVFQESLSAYALLRVIQGLHLAKASEIRLTISKKRLQLEADGLQSLPTWQQLREARIGANVDSLTASCIGAGLNACELEPCLELSVGWQGRCWNILTDSVSSDMKQKSGRFVLTQAVDSSRLKVKPAERRSRLHSELSERCRFSPCPFKLDSRQLESYWVRRSDDSDHGFEGGIMEWLEHGDGFCYTVDDLQPYEYLDGVFRWARREPAAIVEHRRGFIPAMMYCGIEPGDSHKKEHECRLLVRYTGGSEDCQVHIVRHGVVSEVYTEPRLLKGSKVLVDMSDLKTDLSGLKVVRDSDFGKRFEVIFSAQRSMAELICEHLPTTIPKFIESAIPAFFNNRKGWIGGIIRKLASKVWVKMFLKKGGEDMTFGTADRVKQWLANPPL